MSQVKRRNHAPKEKRMVKQRESEGRRGLSLEERLDEFPEMRQRIEEMLAIMENEAGDVVKADDAEERIIQELRRMGQQALQGWAERKQGRVEQEQLGRAGVTRKEKKTSLA